MDLLGRDKNKSIQLSGAMVPVAASLKTVLRNIGPVPAYSALVGSCQDGLPFMWNMAEARKSVAISGDGTALLKTILASAALLNSARDVKYLIVCPNSGDYWSVSGYANCMGVLSVYDRASTSAVVRMSELAEQRKSGRNRGAMTLLVIDSLHLMLDYHEHELKEYLKWLAFNGPYSDVLPVVSADMTQVRQADTDLFSHFGEFIVGNGAGFSNGSTKFNPLYID